jgi:L-aminopeptidase/D-esterase-like protein
MPASGISIIEGILVGEHTDRSNRTGVSVIYFKNPASAGVYKYGSATSTRQIDSLEASHTVSRIDAIVLAGGSAFGLDAGCGVMTWLKEKGRGVDLRGITIPIAPTAAIFDLRFSAGVTPDCTMGYLACNALSKDIHEGSFGAGTGATVGKINGMESAVKGGVGTSYKKLQDGVGVGVYVVVNAFGDVMDTGGKIIAGARVESSSNDFIDTSSFIRDIGERGSDKDQDQLPQNTTLCVVATDALFDKASLITIAKMASAGIARSLSPAGTSYDGDLVFAVSTGEKNELIDVVGDVSAHLVEEAIRSAVINADGFGVIPAYRDIKTGRKA